MKKHIPLFEEFNSDESEGSTYSIEYQEREVINDPRITITDVIVHHHGDKYKVAQLKLYNGRDRDTKYVYWDPVILDMLLGDNKKHDYKDIKCDSGTRESDWWTRQKSPT